MKLVELIPLNRHIIPTTIKVLDKYYLSTIKPLFGGRKCGLEVVLLD